MEIVAFLHKSFRQSLLLKLSLSANAVLLLSFLSQQRHSSRDTRFLVNGSSSSSGGVCSIGSPAAMIADEHRTTPCSGHGFLLQVSDPAMPASCKCHRCFRGESCSLIDPTCTIDLDHGDPIMFEEYWRNHSVGATTVILGWQRLSYFAEAESICWFLDHRLANSIRSLHEFVGNAITDGRHLVVGTGSTQLYQAALYALAPQEKSSPTIVVCSAPFYSSYPLVTDYLKSSIYEWGGDANVFDRNSVANDNYIELVTSPNNPDGGVRRAVVGGNGPVVHDLAYYWPQYTAITEAADYEIMLFTVSKSTGHAGTRIGRVTFSSAIELDSWSLIEQFCDSHFNFVLQDAQQRRRGVSDNIFVNGSWAIVKDPLVARKMTKFIELNTIGVSQDAQLRAAQVLQAVVSSHGRKQFPHQQFFHHSVSVLEYRWRELRSVVALSDTFSLPAFEPGYCTFSSTMRRAAPAFAWLRCNHAADCEEFMRQNGISVRSGVWFGSDKQQVRMSMLDRSVPFELLLDRLAAMQQQERPRESR